VLQDKTLRFGVIGTVVAALCCFTPLLVLLLTGVGIGWAIGYVDYVLLPALFVFVGLTGYALWKRPRALPTAPRSHPATDCACPPPVPKPASPQGNEK
jgi:mercuric ion transport protein